MAFLHEEEDDHTHTDEKKEYGAEDRYLSEPQKAHITGEFIIVAKFGGHAFRHLMSFSLWACKCDQAGREAERQGGSKKICT